MKKILAILMAMALMLSMVVVASAEEEQPLIGILAPATTHGWVGGVTYYAQQKADELGLNYKLLTSSDADEMSSQIDQLVDLGAKAIVVWPQFTGVELAAERALEQGIIIYNFDMIIDVDEKYADLMYVLTGDNYGMGVEGAKYIAEKLEGQGKVLVMNKPAAGNVNDDRCRGFYDTLAEVAPDIEVIAEVSTDFARDKGQADMADALTAYDEIDAVFSLDDETSIGALQAILEAERTDVKAITGGGGCQEYFNMMLADEYQNIWVASATYSPSMIATCIENCVKVLNGEEVEHTIVDPSVIVDRDNAADFLDENTPY
jgi:ribose transport system substrate-binding protein